MPNSLDLPLHLFQVLEEEYLSLHGSLDQRVEVNLAGQSIISWLDWKFHQGHIKDFQRFKARLQGPNADLPENVKQLLTQEKQLISAWGDEEDARIWLNARLRKKIYDEQQFRHFKLGETTQKLFELYAEEPNQVTDEELIHLNRFLLEDLFPEDLEKIHNIRLAAMYERQHEKKPAALSFSGGGIRSGTFALGLLQGLARHNLLEKFDYLSTVSGGGYIGGWLTAWIHRHPGPDRGLPGVIKDLTNAEPGSKIDPDSPALRHLREYSNFLTPKAGLLSTDTWTFLAIYVRNLLLNWSVIIPLILGVLLIPRLAVASVLANPTGETTFSWLGYTFRFGLRHLFLALGFFFAAWAIAYISFSRPGLRTRLIERNPRWKDRLGQRGFLVYCLLPLLAAGVLLTNYWAWTPNQKRWWQFLLFGLLATVVGWLWSTYVLRQFRRDTWRENSVMEPLLLFVVGGIGGLLARAGTVLSGADLTATRVDLSWATEMYASFAVPLFLLMFVLAVTSFAGISSHLHQRVNDEDREWWARFSAWALISALAWAVFSLLVIFGPLALLYFPKLLGAVGGLSGLVAVLLGRSSKTPANAEKAAQGNLLDAAMSRALPLLAAVFIAIFVASLSLLTSKLTVPATEAVFLAGQKLSEWTNLDLAQQALVDVSWPDEFNIVFPNGPSPCRSLFMEAQAWQLSTCYEHMRVVHYPRWWFYIGLTILLLAVGFLLARLINLNLFSLHGSYRNRLIRGFLAASRDKRLRRPNPFTGFDPADNVFMHELRPALLHEVDFKDIDNFAGSLKTAGAALGNTPAGPASQRQPTTTSGFIYAKLSEKGQDAVNGYNNPAPLSQRQRVDLIEDLNRILEDEQIRLWAVPVFNQVPQQQAGASQSQQAGAPAPPQQREYHIHRNRRTLEQAYPQFIEESNYPPHRLLHVVNTTLNLVGGDNLAWQQRKAESFTVSPLHSGCYRLGYRKSKDYGGDDGISLGTAVAISGAAASSNMGYYTSSPVLSLVLTLFNVRLGWWLGNPGPAGSRSYAGLPTDDRPGSASKKIYRRASPTYSVEPIIYEAFGLTDDRNKYVYLSDGGHFENLALYEMVLRRCHLIVVSDGAADANYQFNDLGNAVRKIRIDLGVPIEFPDVPIYREAPTKEGAGGSYWAIGRIRYSEIDRRPNGKKAKDGILLYIKPAIYEDEPEDVVHYKRTHPTFPNETTADQFFDEPQFESYRALGSYIMDRICGSHAGDLDLARFVFRAYRNLLRLAPQIKGKARKFKGRY